MKIKSILLAVFVLVSACQAQQDAGASPEAGNEHWRGVHVGIDSRKAVEQLTGVVGELSGLGINVIVGEIT
ncbi:MAG: hypothetical protein H8E73_06930, partial [Planctomycetes bacterium]|nr:hypothetical protein [Planctomycetota bacterium]